MEKNSPNRFASYDRMKEGEAKTRFRGRLFGMYKRLQWVRRDQPMYDVKLQQVKIDDDIYSISRELRRAGSDDDRRTFLEGQLQASVSKLVDAQAAERKLRLERLQQEVQRLQQQVDGEKSLRDEAIRQAMDRARKGWSPTSRPLGPDKDRDRGPDHQRGSDRGRDRDADAEGNDDRAHAPEESR